MQPHVVRDRNRQTEGEALKRAASTEAVAGAGDVTERMARDWRAGRHPSPISRAAEFIRNLGRTPGASPWPVVTVLRIAAYESEAVSMDRDELVGSFWTLMREALEAAARFVGACGGYAVSGDVRELHDAATVLSSLTAEFASRCSLLVQKRVDPREGR